MKEKAEKMFALISSKTNFHELVERPEWPHIHFKIVKVIENHAALLKAAKSHILSNPCDSVELLNAIAQAEGKEAL